MLYTLILFCSLSCGLSSQKTSGSHSYLSFGQEVLDYIKAKDFESIKNLVSNDAEHYKEPKIEYDGEFNVKNAEILWPIYWDVEIGNNRNEVEYWLLLSDGENLASLKINVSIEGNEFRLQEALKLKNYLKAESGDHVEFIKNEVNGENKEKLNFYPVDRMKQMSEEFLQCLIDRDCDEFADHYFKENPDTKKNELNSFMNSDIAKSIMNGGQQEVSFEFTYSRSLYDLNKSNFGIQVKFKLDEDELWFSLGGNLDDNLNYLIEKMNLVNHRKDEPKENIEKVIPSDDKKSDEEHH